MRIIAGNHKGRKFPNPQGGDVRPTSDRVREALFSVLEGLLDFDSLSVLDLYAGTGSFGIEALSRGAESAVFIEANPKRADALRRFVEDLGESAGVSVHTGAVDKVLKRDLTGCSFELIFADPPYGQHPGLELLDWLDNSGCIADEALIVIESSSDLTLSPRFSAEQGLFELVKDKVYGDTSLWYYRYAAGGRTAGGNV